MINFFKNLYITNNFFKGLLILVALFIISFFIKFLYYFCLFISFLFIFIFLIEIFLLYINKNPISIVRKYPEKFSNSDENECSINLRSNVSHYLFCRIIDEIPIQFQKRDFEIKYKLKSNQQKTFYYNLIPKKRGEYKVGFCNVFISIFNLAERKIILKKELNIACYPSFIQLRKYSILATHNRLHELGIKKIRKIGSSFEFEQINQYTKGDNYKHINWKATAKKQELMVNRFQDEKSQPIYCLLDTGRTMEMSFNEMTLLDYSINSSMLISHVSINKGDKSGILTFSKNIETFLESNKNKKQIKLISESLYNVNTLFSESEYGTLYNFIRKKITHRSLLFLFSNFETLDALKRQIKYLKLINKNHVLVIVLFVNTEIKKLSNKKDFKNISDYYDQTIAEKFIIEKKLIAKELQLFGIQTILCEPKNLTISTLNKYLEIKSRNVL